MAETDLYPPIKRFLESQGYEVKGEVNACDVVAVRGLEAPVVVEIKQAFNLKLLLQGVDRQRMTDAVYLAIPAPKPSQRWDIHALCKRLGLGLLTLHGPIVEAELDPAPYAPRKNIRARERLLKEFHRRQGDPNAGGSTRRPLMTAYRQDALKVARAIAGGTTRLKDIRAATSVGRAASIVQSDVYGWFARAERGVYGLTAKGTEALETWR